MLDWMKAILSDNAGNPSSMRLVVALVVLIQVGTWAYVSVKTVSLAPMDWQQIMAILGPLGIQMTQKGKELSEAGMTTTVATESKVQGQPTVATAKVTEVKAT